MVSALAFLLAAQTTKPLIAYCARYYNTGSGGSTIQVYICDLDGKNRRAITTGKADKSGVRWVGPKRLVWFTDEKNDLIRKWTMTWPGGKATSEMLDGDNWHLHDDFSDFEPNIAIVDHSDTPFMVSPQTGKLVSPPPVNPLGLVTQYDDQGHEATIQGVAYAWSLKDCKLTLKSGDKQWEFPFEDGVVTTHFDPKRKILWIREWTHDSTMGGHTSIYRLSFANHKPIKVVNDASRLDFWPTRDLFVYNTPRDLLPLPNSKKQVWTSSIFVGSQKSGSVKKVVSGLVNVVSVSLQPDH